MNIAIFGGAFDPPHRGHKNVADSLVKEGIVDEVWFVPVFKHPWADRYSKHKFAQYDTRVEMIEAFIGDNQKVAHFKDVSFTYDTLKYFQDKYPEHKFSWVMGSEYLDRFDDFLKGHPKLVNFHFYIYPRSGSPFDEKYLKDNMTFLTHMSEVVASSTETKKRIKGGSSVSKLLVKSVEDIILESMLYTK